MSELTMQFPDMTREQFQVHLDQRSVNTHDAARVATWFSEDGVQRRVATGETARRRNAVREAMEALSPSRSVGRARTVSPRSATRVQGSRMRVRVDQERCQGHNRCWAVAPELFDIDDHGYSHESNDGVVPAAQEQNARLAVANCPEFAISIEEE